ncbi:MAG: hypothetical protein RLO03_13985 [Balneola sp.]
MSFIELGTYNKSEYTYKLSYSGSKEFETPLSFIVLDHFSRRGITKPDLKSFHFPSDVTVRFFNNSEDVLEWFTGSGEKSFMIEIFKNGNNIFQGFYLPNPQYISYNSASSSYDLKFHDGIELLKNSTNTIDTFTTIDVFLRSVLDSIGFSLPINVIINLTAANMLIKDFSPASMRTKFQTLLDRNPSASNYDLLSAFLTVFKAFIYQEEGKWIIKEYVNRDSNLNFEIDTNGVVTSNSPTRPVLTPTILEDSSRKPLRGINKYLRSVNNNNQSSLIRNSDFSDWNEDYTVLNEWELEAGTIIPPFQFEDFNGVIFTDSDTSLYQKITRISTGYGLPKFNFEGNVYIDGSVGTYDIAIAEIIVYIRDAEDREAGFTKYWAHEPSVSTELSLTQEFIFAEVEIASGHSFNVPVDFAKIIDIPLTLYSDFYFEIRLLDQEEAVLTSFNSRRREYNLVQLESVKSLREVSDSTAISVSSSNTEGAEIEDEVYFSDDLAPLRESEFQILDENLIWQDVTEWRGRSENDEDALTLNQKVIDKFLESYSSSRLFIKLKILKSTNPTINTELQITHNGTTKSFDILFIQEHASIKATTVYAIEST